jgi:hypothetical protein
MNELKLNKTPSRMQWILASVNVIISIILISALGKLFPYTGLAAIIIIPFIVIVNIIINIITVYLSRNKSQLTFIIIWVLAFALTQYFTMRNFPQDFRPNTIQQLKNIKTGIDAYANLTIQDLDLPFKVTDFSRYDCEIIDAQEKYIVTLFKYKNIIPLDGSFHIYREDVIGGYYDRDTRITKIDSIPIMLRTGQEKLIWYILQKTKE